MTLHAAFLRGMNLGGRRITNSDLCGCFEALGFTGVAAFLASGNVVLDPEPEEPNALARRIETGLQNQLGYAVPTFLRTAEEIRAMARHEPFPRGVLDSSEGKLQVVLLRQAPAAADRDAVLALATDQDRLAFAECELYWLPDGPMSQSELDLKTIERRLGTTTIRTARTIGRMVAKYF